MTKEEQKRREEMLDKVIHHYGFEHRLTIAFAKYLERETLDEELVAWILDF